MEMVPTTPVPGGARSSRPRGDDWALLGITAVGALTLIFFWLHTGRPLLDEWVRRWQIESLVVNHSLNLTSHSFAFVQTALGAGLDAIHVPARAWRFTALPFLVSTAVFAYLVGRRAGAVHYWAAVAALAVVVNPVTLSLSAAYMTEIFFLGLLLPATWCSIRWVEDGTWIKAAVVVAGLAALQKQQALAIPVATTAALLLQRRLRPNWRDAAGLAAMWVVVGGIIAIPYVEGLATVSSGRAAVVGSAPTMGVASPGGVADTGPTPMVGVLEALGFLPVMVGLYLLPLSLGSLGRRTAERRMGLSPEGLVSTLLLAVGLGFCLLILTHGGSIFLGGVITPFGIGDLYLAHGHKVPLFPLPLLRLMEVTVISSAVVSMGWRAGAWRTARPSIAATALLLAAAAQAGLAVAHGYPTDRFFLPALALLVPAAAAVLPTGAPRSSSRLWALGCLCLFVVAFAVGEQDRQAWEEARHQAALRAYARYAPVDVNAGWEEIGSNLVLPYSVYHLGQPAVGKPAYDFYVDTTPPVELDFAAPGDPREGITYWSMAPGKIVIQVNR